MSTTPPTTHLIDEETAAPRAGSPTPTHPNGVSQRPGQRSGARGTLRGTDAFQPVLTIRAAVNTDQAARFTREALREIHAYIVEHDLEVQGPPFSISHPLQQHRLDIEAGWPVTGAYGSGRIQTGALPIACLHGSRHSASGRQPLTGGPIRQ